MRGRTLLGLFVVTVLVYVLSPVVQNSDSYPYPATAFSLVHDGDLDLTEFRSTAAIEGHYAVATAPSGQRIVQYPWIPALLFVPPLVALDVAHAFGIGSSPKARLGSTLFNDQLQLAVAGLVTALAVVLVALIAFERLSGDERRRRRLALLIATGFAFGTAAWSTTSRALWQHGPGLVAVGLAVLAAQRLEQESTKRLPRTAAILGASVALAYTLRPPHALSVVAFTVWVAWRQRRHLVPYLVGAALVAVPWVAVNLVTWRAVLPPYFSANRLGVRASYLNGLAGSLVSPGRGLLLFCPLVLLVIARSSRRVPTVDRRLRPLDIVLGAVVAVHLLAAAALAREAWWGGHSYGPRLSSDLLVYLAALCVPVVDHIAVRAGTAGAIRHRPRPALVIVVLSLVWSVAVSSQGALSRATTCWNVRPNNIDLHPERLWDWGDPQFLAGVKVLWRTKSVRAAVGDPCATPAASSSRGLWELGAFI